MGTIVLMMGLKFADVSLPAEVVFINEGNNSIVFVRGDVLEVGVDPLRLTHLTSPERSDLLFLFDFHLRKLFYLDFGVNLEVLRILRGILNDFILVCDDSNLNTIRIRLDLDSLFEVVVDLLDAIEALNSMFIHRVGLVCED